MTTAFTNNPTSERSLVKFRLLAVVTALFFTPGIFAQSAVFLDTFGNGVVADADNYAAFWKANTEPSNVTTIAESGGALVLTSGDGTNSSYLNAWVNSAISRDFNFFRRKLRLSATVAFGGTALDDKRFAAFSFSSAANRSYNSPDTIALILQGNKTVFLGTKQGKSYASPVAVPVSSGGTSLNYVTVPGTITGFELTLDATTYQLKITHAGGTGSTTYTGAHGLSVTRWGNTGDSALTIESGRTNVITSTSVISVDQLSVEAVDASTATALFQDSFNNTRPADSDEKNLEWTNISLPDSSTAIETAGALTLTASKAGAGTVIASLSTPTAPRFNFFDQTFRISADFTVGGTVADAYRRPNRLTLASAAGNGQTADDVIFVSMREYGLLLGTKVNAAGTAPNSETQSNPADPVKHLIGNYKLNDRSSEYVSLGGQQLNHVDFTLDSRRYRLDANAVGEASGLARFTGAHGLSRSSWGTTGDSALVLESVRDDWLVSTGLNPVTETTITTAFTKWDNLRVAPSFERLLAERYWDYTVTYNTSASVPPTTRTESYRVWLPTTEPVIRGVIFLASGSGGDHRSLVHDPIMQETARALGFALIGYRNAGNMNLWSRNAALIKPAVQRVLTGAAVASARPEISNAPLLITGFSAGSRDASFLAAYWPERTISFVSHRGGGRIIDPETETVSFYSIPKAMFNDTLKKIPGLFVAGGADGGTDNSPWIVRENFLTWRSRGAQVAFAVDWRIDHTVGRNASTGAIANQSWEATMTWLVEVANRRYPRPQLPPTGLNPTTWNLINLADNSGWLGDNPRFSSGTTPNTDGTSVFTPIAPFDDYPASNILTASWLPSETAARMYQSLVSTDRVSTRTAAPLQSPLRIVSPAQYADTVPVGQAVSIAVDPREFDDTSTISQLEFYDGATLLGTDTTGPEWSLTFTPTTTGVHTLSVVATRSGIVNSKSAAFTLLQVVPSDFPPVVSATQAASLPANTAYAGTVAATDPEGDPITYSVVTAPQRGLVTLNPTTGAYTYSPAHRYAGNDTLVLRASAGASFTDVTVSLTINAPADTNANGLPDAWETANGVTNPALDPDGDGMTNLQEYLANTVPTSATSVFATTSFTSNAGPPASFTLTWSAVGGVRYRVQYTNDLTAGFMDIVRPAAQEIQPGTYGVGSPATFTDNFTLTPPAGARRFYRVRIVTGAE